MVQQSNDITTYKIDALESDFLSPILKRYYKNDNFPTELVEQKSDEDLSKSIASHALFDSTYRQGLVDEIFKQYEKSNISLGSDSLVYQNLIKLNESNTLTVTTGQQIHIFLGPFFVVNKILSCCAEANKLQQTNSDYNYVPVFWMATEDHDFEEIRSARLYNEVYEWDVDSNGPVGRLDPSSLLPLVDQALNRIDQTEENIAFLNTCKNAYSTCKTFADATRQIVHSLFEKTGIVIVDADSAFFKQKYSSTIQKDVVEETCSPFIDENIEILKTHGIKAPINTRPSNHFYLETSMRDRIEKTSDGSYVLVNQNRKITEEEVLRVVNKTPEMFSPNALLRPIYQQNILPNFAYLCGGSEFVYWLELNGLAKELDIPFPRLMLRKSCFFLHQKNMDYLIQEEIPPSFLFLDTENFKQQLLQNSEEKSKLIEDNIATIQKSADQLFELFDTVNNINTKSARKSHNALINKLLELQNSYNTHRFETNQHLNKIIKIKEKVFGETYVQERHKDVISMVHEMGISLRTYLKTPDLYENNNDLTLIIE